MSVFAASMLLVDPPQADEVVDAPRSLAVITTITSDAAAAELGVPDAMRCVAQNRTPRIAESRPPHTSGQTRRLGPGLGWAWVGLGWVGGRRAPCAPLLLTNDATIATCAHSPSGHRMSLDERTERKSGASKRCPAGTEPKAALTRPHAPSRALRTEPYRGALDEPCMAPNGAARLLLSPWTLDLGPALLGRLLPAHSLVPSQPPLVGGLAVASLLVILAAADRLSGATGSAYGADGHGR